MREGKGEENVLVELSLRKASDILAVGWSGWLVGWYECELVD